MMMIQYAGNLISLGVMRPENVYETVKQLMTIWGWRDYERYLSDPNETEQMKQILAMIEQMGMAMQQGQAPCSRATDTGVPDDLPDTGTDNWSK